MSDDAYEAFHEVVDGPAKRTVSVGFAVKATLFLCAVFFAVGLDVGQAAWRGCKPEPGVVAPAQAPSVKPAPACIHQACSYGPAHLQCADLRTGIGQRSDVCARWDIQYENNCTCDRWATEDGGVW